MSRKGQKEDQTLKTIYNMKKRERERERERSISFNKKTVRFNMFY
jgi:hypothetical protein